MRTPSLTAVFALLALMLAAPLFTNLAHAQSYTPGVKVGDSVTFGKITAIWRSNSTPPSFIQQYNQAKSIQENITSVVGNTVSASQTFIYKNGTRQTTTGTIDVQYGYGNLGYFVLAGGLSAGDVLYQNPNPYPSYYPTIEKTVTKLYAGALRSINVVNQTSTNYGQQVVFNWDAKTGLLVDLYESVSFYLYNFLITFSVTSTNVWQASTTPDFGFDAIQQSPSPLYIGQTGAYKLVLNSTLGFHGIIQLKPTLLNSTQNSPVLTLSLTSVTVSPGRSNSSILRFATNASTTIGSYLFSVNATSGSLSHTDIILVTVLPPDFDLIPHPANLTIAEGSSKTATITVTSLGSFSGTVTLYTSAYNLITATIQPTSVTLSSTVSSANATLTVQVPQGTPPTPYDSVVVSGTNGLLYHQTYLPINVTGPDFRISANPTLLNIKPGTTAQSAITLSSVLGFSGTVLLSTYTYNYQITASLDTYTAFVNSTTTAKATLTVTVPSNIPAGFQSVYVDGNSGSLAHSAYVDVNVTAPDFRLNVTPTFFNLSKPSNATATISLLSSLGFQGTVLLNANDYGSNGPTLSVSPSVVNLTPNGTATAKLTIATASANPGFYYVQVTGTSGTLSHTFYVTVQVIGPDFLITATPSYLTIKPGASAKSTISLSSILKFNGTLTLNTSPYVVTASLDKNTVSVNSTIPATATLTVSVPSYVAPGFYNIYVTATSGNLTHNAYIGVNVVAPGFRINVNPFSVSLKQGSSTNATITLSSILGFQGKVSLTASIYGSNGPTFIVNPPLVTLPANGTATSTLEISALKALPGSYSIYITGTSGNVTQSGYLSVTVTGPDFSITANPPSLTIRSGNSAKSTISLNSILNFNGTLALSTSSYVVSSNLDKNSVSLNSTTPATTTLTVTVPSYISPGFYSAYVTATSGNLTHTAYIGVNVVAPSFQISVNPSVISLKVGSSINSTITVTSTLGFSGTVSLFTTTYNNNGPSLIINPSAVTLTANGTATSTLEISALNAVPGYYSISITGTSGGLQQYAYVNVNVIGPDFSMASNPYYINLQQGRSASSLVTISRINNFNGTIALSTYYYGQSGGITVSLSTTSVTLSSSVTSATVNVTITASATATPGYYGVSVYGVSGRLSRSAFIQVNLIPAPDFGIFTSLSTDFNSGAQGTSTITVTPQFGFTGNVNITTTTSPSTGLTVNCPSRITVPSFAAASATCTLTSTTPGAYTVQVFARSGTLSHNATFASYVGGFTISMITPVDFDLGSTGQALVSITSSNRLSGNITLTGSGSGLTVNCPAITDLSANANVKRTCSVAGTVAGTYQVTIKGTASPGGLSYSATAIVHIGDFEISASSGGFNAGASGTSITISLTSTFNFRGSVSLSIVTAPAPGLTVDCPANAIPVIPNSTSTGSCILTSTSPATYQITVTGKATNGTASHDTTSVIHVGDFAIGIVPVDVNSGSSGTMSVSLTSINNFEGPISVTGSSSTGLTIACPDAPASIVANSTITTYCTLSSNTSGTYSVTVTGTSTIGTASHSTSGLTHVGDFTISITTPTGFSLGASGGLITVNLTSKLNFAGTIVLSPNSSPTKGLAVTCPAMELTANSSSSAACMFNADIAGTYLLTIRGNSLPGTGSHSTSRTIQVVDFTVSAGEVSPSTISVGDSGSSSITIAPVNGFTGTVVLAVSSPSGLACSFDQTTIQSVGTSTLSCTGVTAGDYKVTVTAIGGSIFRQTSLNFHVKPAPSPTASSPTMFGLQLPQFFGVVGAVIVGITVAGVTLVVRRKRP